MSTAPPPDAVAETAAPMEPSPPAPPTDVAGPKPIPSKCLPAAPDGLATYRLTVDQYHRIVEAGILEEEDRVELLNGYLSETMPHSPRRSSAVRQWGNRLVRTCPEGMTPQVQLPVTLSDSEPEPDLAIIRGSEADYVDRHPTGEDCLAVVEVAHTSLSLDRSKASIYAAAGIPEYLIIDLDRRRWEHYRQPEGGEYASIRRSDARGTFELPVGNGSVSFDFDAVFGPPAA